MWALDNRTPFAADRSWVRDRDGAEVWLVAVKGTFTINPDGSTRVADEQAEVQVAAKHWGAPGRSSIRYESDLPRTKVTTDIIINGHAYAPRGEPATAVSVRLRVGDVSKTLRVTGDCVWKGFGFLVWRSRCRPFVKMPIIYERAFGGMDLKSKNPKRHKWDPRNPIGTGFAKARSHLIGQPVPNIHVPGFSSLFGFRKPPPAGFGVIAGHWKPRVKLAGTCNAKWQAERAPLLPEDFDERFYQCAPRDQQTAHFLKGGEQVRLTNLTPNGSLAFRLPRVVLGFETDFGGESVLHRANLHTVVVEPDVPRVILVWHTALQCHPKVTKLRGTRIIQKTLLNRPGSEKQEFPAESKEDVFA